MIVSLSIRTLKVARDRSRCIARGTGRTDSRFDEGRPPNDALAVFIAAIGESQGVLVGMWAWWGRQQFCDLLTTFPKQTDTVLDLSLNECRCWFDSVM